MAEGDHMWKIKCTFCGKVFRLPSKESPTPKHPPKGVKPMPNEEYIPCVGSGLIGNILGTKAQG